MNTLLIYLSLGNYLQLVVQCIVGCWSTSLPTTYNTSTTTTTTTDNSTASYRGHDATFTLAPSEVTVPEEGASATERVSVVVELSQLEKRAIKRSWHFISSELKENGRQFFLKLVVLP